MTAAGGRRFVPPAALLCLLAGAPSCAPAPAPPAAPAAAPALPDRDDPFLAEVEERTFRWFWDVTDPATGLVPDRHPALTFSSVAAIGFGLTGYGIGAERGWVTREQAAARVVATLRTLSRAPQGEAAAGVAGHRGFFYHFLRFEDATRFKDVELSTIDTALLMAGVLFVESYFDRDGATEREIRELARALHEGVEWSWLRPRPPLVAMGWYPEKGFHHLDWRGYNEAMLLYVLALGSPTHPIEPEAWRLWTSEFETVRFHGQEYFEFAPLFGHQYSQCWLDLRGLADDATRRAGFDYFESSRRATYAQRAWAIENPRRWKGFGPDVWGVSASDGPADVEHPVNGEKRRFWTYAGRGLGPGFPIEDGTLAPTAAGGSMAFASEIALPALRAMAERYGEPLYGAHGFADAFNPTFVFAGVAVQHGRVVPGLGWFDTDRLGIDQGPILLMIENFRSELVWRTMRRHPVVRRGLERAGMTGGWLARPAE